MKTYTFEEFVKVKTCPSCGLLGKQRKCPKCGRDACDKCIAVDNADCMFCGPNGDIARKVFKPFHERNKHGTRDTQRR